MFAVPVLLLRLLLRSAHGEDEDDVDDKPWY